MNNSLTQLNQIFQKLTQRNDEHIVWDSLLDYMIIRKTGLPHEEVELNYNFTNQELSYLKEYYNLFMTPETDYIDLLGLFYEEHVLNTKKAGLKGQFYTPQYLCDLMAKIPETPTKEDVTVYDPACGSGRMLLSFNKTRDYDSYCIGEDLDEMSVKMTILNLSKYKLRGRVNWIDTLTRKFNKAYLTDNDGNITVSDELEDLSFDVCLANPPYGVKWDRDDNMLKRDKRFRGYDKLAPKSKGDYAFIQHSLYGLDGCLCILMAPGVLFRGQAEGSIRRTILDNNWLSTVVGLPPNLFEQTSIPVTLLIFNKHKRDDKILFIDASEEYYKTSLTNEMREDNLEKILEVIRNRETRNKFSYLASMEDILDNDYNLNIPRYVDTFEEEPPVDLEMIVAEMDLLHRKQLEADIVIKGYCDELGIFSPTPILNNRDYDIDEIIEKTVEKTISMTKPKRRPRTINVKGQVKGQTSTLNEWMV